MEESARRAAVEKRIGRLYAQEKAIARRQRRTGAR